MSSDSNGQREYFESGGILLHQTSFRYNMRDNDCGHQNGCLFTSSSEGYFYDAIESYLSGFPFASKSRLGSSLQSPWPPQVRKRSSSFFPFLAEVSSEFIFHRIELDSHAAFFACSSFCELLILIFFPVVELFATALPILCIAILLNKVIPKIVESVRTYSSLAFSVGQHQNATVLVWTL